MMSGVVPDDERRPLRDIQPHFLRNRHRVGDPKTLNSPPPDERPPIECEASLRRRRDLFHEDCLAKMKLWRAQQQQQQQGNRSICTDGHTTKMDSRGKKRKHLSSGTQMVGGRSSVGSHTLGVSSGSSSVSMECVGCTNQVAASCSTTTTPHHGGGARRLSQYRVVRRKYATMEHSTEHDEMSPFYCLTCELSFCEGDELVEHMKQHFGEMYFTCKQCGKRFGEEMFPSQDCQGRSS